MTSVRSGPPEKAVARTVKPAIVNQEPATPTPLSPYHHASGWHIQSNHSGLSLYPVTQNCTPHRGRHKDWSHGRNSTECVIDIRTHSFSPPSSCYSDKTSDTLPKRWNIPYEFRPVMFKFCMLLSSSGSYHHWT